MVRCSRPTGMILPRCRRQKFSRPTYMYYCRSAVPPIATLTLRSPISAPLVILPVAILPDICVQES